MRTLEQAINAAAPVRGERFDGSDLQEFHISEVEFRTCRFVNCNFDYASVRAAKFLQCSFDHCTFKEATFKDCVFAEGETGSDWRYCDLSKAEFEKSSLSLNKFVGCQGYMLSFTDCAAPGLKADIEAQRKVRSQVIPGGLRFIRCKLQYAEFAPGDLKDSIFQSCDLRDASFAGAKLNGASFRGSSLSNIDFAGAVLDHANLSHASFDELDFQSMASFRALTVTRDQHEAIVTSFGLLTAG
ncbi:pentapeptide repeat-containing protein [Rhizobium sp. C1]|uniref:pentapeptide repeat-containing protein n=1 Tax=Rhizobium sp. C1 TaxID=1349799 RepID=UPI001E2D00A3|nr:pentapeptide repeat-containing protein [Rhizobium sp. C1]MCD2180177.1 pentapeptide repeat-containing protein [Rhizobium sp. C1]